MAHGVKGFLQRPMPGAAGNGRGQGAIAGLAGDQVLERARVRACLRSRRGGQGRRTGRMLADPPAPIFYFAPPPY